MTAIEESSFRREADYDGDKKCTEAFTILESILQ
jgi:hypothetical protein